MNEYRRRLPHYHPDHAYLFLTWRLWGTLPRHRSTEATIAHSSAGHRFVAQDRLLDGHGQGPARLQDSRIAQLVAKAILIGEVERHFYDLSAWVVMPNHVHLLILPQVPVAQLMRWLKGSTAREANRILGRTGQPFWQDESWDHLAAPLGSDQPDHQIH